jgi:hypothetical protein
VGRVYDAERLRLGRSMDLSVLKPMGYELLDLVMTHINEGIL